MRLIGINKVNMHDFVGQIFAQSNNLYITHYNIYKIENYASAYVESDGCVCGRFVYM